MLREIMHVVRGAPQTLRMKARLSQVELYDALMENADAAGLGEQRRALARGVVGRVLEIGCGTGLMFPHYEPDAHVTAIEPDASFLDVARSRAPAARARVEVVEGSATALPFPPASFDAAIASLVLCSVSDVAKVLAELARVLAPGGELRLIEHVRSERAIAGALMAFFDPLWLAVNGQGCHMHRRPEPELERAGFAIEEVVPFQVFTLGIPPFPMRRIRARVAR